MTEKIIFSDIEQGQYTVEMNLNALMDSEQKAVFEEQIPNNFRDEVSSYHNGILSYTSETVLPDLENKNVDKSKEKLLFIFGNPAIHSIANGMFFFSRQNGHRHQLWGKLAIADVAERILHETREREAKERKTRIADGTISARYLVGMATFYSYPTPADGGVKGVEQLFAPIIDKINKRESERILNYSFAKGARLIFVQQSSYDAFRNVTGNKILNTLFWPIRGKGSSGENLRNLLDLGDKE